MTVTETISTPLTKLLGMTHPIMLAGMNQAAGPKLAAAVSNAGGIGVVGGVTWTPKMLRKNIEVIKKNLKTKGLPFGVDLLLPQVGGSARKTNYDYTKGKLPALIDIIIESGASLFVSAVGVPPKWAVEKLHAAGIPIMNMIGAPKHVKKALNAGVDIICAQGGEGGGHTGDVATSILIPTVVDLCRGKKSPLTGEPIIVVAAGGIFDGRGLAMALSLGASGVWVGTRFVASKEAGAPKRHKNAVIKAGYHDTLRSYIFTGRPLRVIKNDFIVSWETEKRKENEELRSKGIIPVYHLFQEKIKRGEEIAIEDRLQASPLLSGSAAGAIDSIKPAAEIVDEMISGAIKSLRTVSAAIGPISKL